MRILIVNTVAWKRNGITNVIWQYYQHLVGDGFEFDFVGINEPSEDMKKEIETHNGRCYVLPHRLKNPIGYLIDLARICKQGGYAAIHAHGNSSTLSIEMIAAMLAGIKNRIAHGHASSCNYHNIHKMLKWVFRSTYTTGLACSEMAGQFLFGDSEYSVLSNAFNVDEFAFSEEQRLELREKLGIKDKCVIGYVATLTETKNHCFLFEVYEQIRKREPQTILFLIGKGPEEDRLKLLAEKLRFAEGEVCFLGERDDVPKLINTFDMVLFPSKNEGLGIALLEAQANGVPVIASNAVIPNKVKLNNNFYFEELNNVESWLQRYFSIDKYRVCDGIQNVKRAGYDINQEVQKLKRIYCDIEG